MRQKLSVIIAMFFLTIGLLHAQDSSIEVRTKTPDVKVYVNNQYKGITKYNPIIEMHYLKIPMATGSYTVRCEAAGFSPSIQQVTVTALGVQVIAEFVGVKDQAESIRTTQGRAEALTGKILVFSEPSGASIDIDGRKQTAQTNAAVTTGIGKKKVRVYFNSRSLEIEFQLEPDEELTVRADFNTMTIAVNKKVTLHFSSAIPGITFELDGKSMGPLPKSVPFNIQDKPYVAKFTLDGYEEKILNLEPKANDMVSVSLSPLKRTAYVTSNPSGATVYLDENGSKKYIGTTPLNYSIPSAGTYSFIGEKTDYLKYESKSTAITYGSNEAFKSVVLSLDAANGVSINIGRDSKYIPDEPLIIGGKQHGIVGSLRQIIVPSGIQTIRIGSRTATFNFEQGKTYTLTPIVPIPETNKQAYLDQKSASSLSGYRKPIPEPKYLSETRTTYSSVANFTGAGALYGFYMGGSVGLLGGLFTQLNADGDGSAVLGLTLTGSALGWIIGAISNPGSKATGSVPVPENIEKNRQARQQWQSDMNAINAHNKGLVDNYNAQIKARNDDIGKANQSRGFLVVSDGKQETKLAF